MTSGELIVVEEVFSPDFDVSITILGSGSRLDGEDLGYVVVAVGLTVISISEITSQGDGERYDFSSVSVSGTVIALEASGSLYK